MGIAALNALASPLSYGGVDQNVSPGFNTAIQSETFSWQHGNIVMVAYNDLSGGSTGKGARSTDGGATFARFTGDPFATGHGSNLGDPAVVWSNNGNRWVVQFLATGCGGQGVGTWLSTDDGATWATGPCAANAGGGNGDRNSSWADNNPSSPFNGYVYASYNDFGIGGGALRVARSSDGGATWAAPVTVVGTFERDVQITGDTSGTAGKVYLAGMNEGGGGAANRTNIMHTSTDGGATWNSVTVGAPYPPPGNVNCSGNSYFRVITPQIRHMGWGQPAAGPGNTVHYVYAQHGASADEGDIYYTRSTDGGATWSVPLLLNTDVGGRTQWMPSLGVTATGAMFVKWYDRRNTSNNDYEVWGRESLNNGLTWLADDVMSDAVIPQPIVQTANCYMGDYDYWQADGTTIQGSWTDSRAPGSGGTQDVYHDFVAPLQGTPTPTPTGTPPTATPTTTRTNTPTVTPTVCGGNSSYSVATGTATIVAGTVDIGSHCDDCNVPVSLPFAVTFYDQSFTTVNVDSNGNMGFIAADDTFTNTCLPDAIANYAIFPHWDDLCTGPCGTSTCASCGIFSSVSGTAPNRIFNLEWRANYYNTNTSINFEVRLYENSATRQIDVVYGVLNGTGSSATVGVQKGTGALFTQFECNTGGLSNGLLLTFTQPACITVTPTRTSTNTPIVTIPPTNTSTPTVTNTPTNTDTPTETPTQGVGSPTVTSCPIQFTDVPQGSTFYDFIRCLACRGIVGGYPDGTFRPNNNVTRGQLSKIVSNSAGFNDPQTVQMFEDVPQGSTFFDFIGRLASRGFINGYPCGGPGEPCVPPGNLPYFRPNANATRGQISKIVSNAAGFIEPVSGQTFEDVPPGSTFYDFIERLVSRGVMNGYPCGGVGEPCVPPGNRPYFRPNNNATRGQTSKIVANTFFPNCQTPGRR